MKWQWIAEYHGMIVIVQRASLLINGISLFIWDITRYKTRYTSTKTDEDWRTQVIGLDFRIFIQTTFQHG